MGHGRTNQPVVVKGERILQGQFAGVGMSLGIKGDKQKGRRRGKRRIRKDKIKRGADREEWRERERETTQISQWNFIMWLSNTS